MALTFDRSARSRTLQCVRPSGGFIAVATIRASSVGVTRLFRPLRCRVCKPAIPSSRNRFRHWHTVICEISNRLAIARML